MRPTKSNNNLVLLLCKLSDECLEVCLGRQQHSKKQLCMEMYLILYTILTRIGISCEYFKATYPIKVISNKINYSETNQFA